MYKREHKFIHLQWETRDENIILHKNHHIIYQKHWNVFVLIKIQSGSYNISHPSYKFQNILTKIQRGSRLKEVYKILLLDPLLPPTPFFLPYTSIFIQINTPFEIVYGLK